MHHDAHGYWLQEAGAVAPVAAAVGDIDADVVVLGGGYTGMWTAWQLLERAPDCRVVLLEADICGHGPSGRNGGFCETLWTSLPSLIERFGAARALAACEASSASAKAIGAWCEAEGVDAWYTPAGYVMASTTEDEDAKLDAILAVAPGDRVLPLDREAVHARCDSPAFRRAVFVPDDATVQPARLALGLRRRLLERGVHIFERSRVRALQVTGPQEVVADTGSARVRARAAVLALNAATRGVRPLRSRLSVTSSHIVLTEPVPDVLEQIGWTGGEAVTDGRLLVHYFRTTRDHRIAFGWGGGRLAWGARTRGRVEVDADVVAVTHDALVRLFPALAGRRITHAWGGPIDVSPSHLPQIGSLGDAVHYAFGYTGNGVGPSHLAGRILSGLALGAHDADTELALVDPRPAYVPPEPFAWVGGMIVRRALVRAEHRLSAGRRPDLLTRAVAAAPKALGMHVSR